MKVIRYNNGNILRETCCRIDRDLDTMDLDMSLEPLFGTTISADTKASQQYFNFSISKMLLPSSWAQLKDSSRDERMSIIYDALKEVDDFLSSEKRESEERKPCVIYKDPDTGRDKAVYQEDDPELFQLVIKKTAQEPILGIKPNPALFNREYNSWASSLPVASMVSRLKLMYEQGLRPLSLEEI